MPYLTKNMHECGRNLYIYSTLSFHFKLTAGPTLLCCKGLNGDIFLIDSSKFAAYISPHNSSRPTSVSAFASFTA